MRLALLTALGCAMLLGGCGDEDSLSVSDQPLAGTIDGAEWVFVSGNTNAFLDDEDAYFGSLYATIYEGCGLGPSEEGHLLLGIPTAVGEYPFNLQRNVTFSFKRSADEDQQNLVATQGLVVVDSVEDGVIKGGVHAIFDDDNVVDGRFEVRICTD